MPFFSTAFHRPLKRSNVPPDRTACDVKTDYTEGGHGYVYAWVPHNQIWIEKDIHVSELPFIVAHEYTELRLMRDCDFDYDRAHAICSKVEFDLRWRRPIEAFFGSRHIS